MPYMLGVGTCLCENHGAIVWFRMVRMIWFNPILPIHVWDCMGLKIDCCPPQTQLPMTYHAMFPINCLKFIHIIVRTQISSPDFNHDG